MSRSAAHVSLWVRQRIVTAVPDPIWQRVRIYVHGRSTVQRRLRQWRMAPARSALRPDVTVHVITLHGQTLLARPVTDFHATNVLDANLDLVTGPLATAGIEHAVLPAEPAVRRRVVVPARHRKAAIGALRQSQLGRAAYLVDVRADHPGRPVLLGGGLGGLPADPDVVRVFDVLCSPDRMYLSGAELGCDVEFWAEAGPGPTRDSPVAGSLIAPRRNAWVDVIEPADWRLVDRDVNGTSRPALAGIRREHLLSVSHPIDVVYTWVDGSDPVWLARKAGIDTDDSRTVRHPTADGPSRYQSRDELRYSLRSLDMYADWVRHVYLVTDGQLPSWLRTDHERLTVVDHRELFAARGRLPTFNSHAIESQLHHIDGLAEHYLYLNDDVFIGRPVPPGMFFHGNGVAKFFLSTAKLRLGEASSQDAPVMSAAKNNRALVEEHFGRQISNKFKHVPHPQARSVLADMERDFAEDFRRTASSQLRHHRDISIPSALQHYYAYATGRAVAGEIRYLYVDIADPNAAYRLEKLLHNRTFDAFCLNDNDSSAADPVTQSRLVSEFLRSYYPLPSSFEKSSFEKSSFEKCAVQR